MKASADKFLAVGLWLSFTLFSRAQPVITNQPTDQFVFNGGNATFSIMATGVGPFIYQWVFNVSNSLSTNVIATVAGSGSSSGSLGEGGSATNATVNYPEGIAVDQMGDVLIADGSSRIRKVDTNGIITTMAGRSPSGFSGDGGAATNAQLQSSIVTVSGIAVDYFGNIFISDTGNNRVRRVDTNGIITTVAGNGSGFFAGDGGMATNAKVMPQGIVLDHFGNLFIADTLNRRIRKVDINGIITTYAGTGSSGFSGDNGTATNAQLQNPMGVAVDNFGNLFIADTGNNRVRKVDANGIITTVAGTNSVGYSGDGGSAVVAKLNQPSRVILDDFGNFFITDTSNGRIRKVDTNGIITTVAGKTSGSLGGGGPATNALLHQPLDMALDSCGNLFIADSQNNRIRMVDLAGSPVLFLNKITTNNAGNYQVIITSPSGSVTSSIVSLTVFYITTQPTNAKAAYGSAANLNVSVSGDAPFDYQWFTSSGRSASAVPFISNGSVLSANIIDGGAGYVSAPQVQFIGGSGSGAGGKATINNGALTSISITNSGSGYAASTPPAIQIGAPSPTINMPLSDQTNATLALPAVTGTDTTNYFVVVTNNFGSITSATVLLTVFIPPQNFTAKNIGTGLQLQLTGTPNYPYILQSATNLAPPISWKSIRTNSADASGNWQFTVPNLNGGQNFYRAVGQ